MAIIPRPTALTNQVDPRVKNLPAGTYTGTLKGTSLKQATTFMLVHDGSGNIASVNVTANMAGGYEVWPGGGKNNDLVLSSPQNDPDNIAAAICGTLTIHAHAGVMQSGQLPTFAIALRDTGFTVSAIDAGVDAGGDFEIYG